MIETSDSTRVVSKLNTIFSGQTLEPLGPKYSNVVLRISPIFSSCFPLHLCLDDARIVTNAHEVAATGSLAYLLC